MQVCVITAILYVNVKVSVAFFSKEAFVLKYEC